MKPAELVLVFGYPLTGALSALGNTTLGNVTALTGINDDSPTFKYLPLCSQETAAGRSLTKQADF